MHVHQQPCLLLFLSGTARVFSANTHQCLMTLEGHDGEISKVSHMTRNGFSAIACEKLFYVTRESQSLTPSVASFCFTSLCSVIQFCIKFFIIISFIWTGTVHDKILTLYITRRGALQRVLANCYFPSIVPGQVDGTYNKLKRVT